MRAQVIAHICIDRPTDSLYTQHKAIEAFQSQSPVIFRETSMIAATSTAKQKNASTSTALTAETH